MAGIFGFANDLLKKTGGSYGVSCWTPAPAVMVGLVPAIHAAGPPPSVIGTDNPLASSR
jgi:hypothetical protein